MHEKCDNMHLTYIRYKYLICEINYLS